MGNLERRLARLESNVEERDTESVGDERRQEILRRLKGLQERTVPTTKPLSKQETEDAAVELKGFLSARAEKALSYRGDRP